MALIGIDILEISGYTGSFIMTWYKKTTPLVEAGRSDAIAFPVPPQKITAANLSPVVYIFKFWQSSDGIALDTLLGQWDIDASAYNGGVATTYEYVVDRGYTNLSPTNTGTEVWADPANGDTEIVDERYAGAAQDELQVSMRATGIRRSDEWSVLPGGGIQLEVSDETFTGDGSTGDSIFVTHFRKVSTNTNNSGGSDYSDVLNVNADITVDVTFANKLINCISSQPVTIIDFPDVATLGDQKLKFSTHGMAGNYLSLHFALGNSVLFNGENKNKIHIPKGKTFELLIKSGAYYVLDDKTGYDLRGKRTFVDKLNVSQILLNGAEYQIDEMPGLWEFVENLPATQKTTDLTAWGTIAGNHKYYYNIGGGVFKVPNDVNVFYRSLVDFTSSTDAERYGTTGTLGGAGSNAPGSFQSDANKQHNHSMAVEGGGSTNRQSLVTNANSDEGLSLTDLTGDSGGIEARPKNVGQFAALNL
jgi:hypothetical protein